MIVVEAGRTHRFVGEDISQAQGVCFLCPKCFEANGGGIGTHVVICWFYGKGVPDSETPGPGRWTVEGTGFADLTLGANPHSGGRASIQLEGGCRWHGHVINGNITTC